MPFSGHFGFSFHSKGKIASTGSVVIKTAFAIGLSLSLSPFPLIKFRPYPQQTLVNQKV